MENNNQKKSTHPCDYCINSEGNTCPVKMCYEYSRWTNDGTAPREVIETVEDYHYDRW